MNIGTTVRLKPGLRNRPQISGKTGTVVDTVNDRIKVQIAGNIHLVERSELER
jgi:hypothetical protein